MASFLPISAVRFPSTHPQDYSRGCGGNALLPQSQRVYYDSPLQANNRFVANCSLAKTPEKYALVEEHRPLTLFPPDIWDDRFDNFSLEDQLKIERYVVDVEPLKEEVRAILLDKSHSLIEKINLINTVERLGFPYYYEKEINDLLENLFKQVAESNFDFDYDLSDTAILFRIFRQHGYKIPSEIFSKFKNEGGKFKEELKNDEKGIFSLYEAAHLRGHGEDILEEAFVFTSNFLTSIASSSKAAREALVMPLHRGFLRLQSQNFISSYEQDESHNEKLLQLAKSEFNRVQLIHRKELSEIQQWWKNLDLSRKLSHVRHRNIEVHFISLSLCYEPQYSLSRIFYCKMWGLMVALDDTYDAYGTFDELRQLTKAFDRWDLSTKDELPADFLKTVYELIINECVDFEKELTRLGKSFAGYYSTEQVREAIRSHVEETKWREDKYVPKFDEYMATRRCTSGVRSLVTAAVMGIDEITDEKTYDQLLRHDAPKVIIRCEDLIRLRNDLVSGKLEVARGSIVASSIECYMKEHNVSREEALEALDKLIEDAWKDINETGFSLSNNNDAIDQVSKPLYNLIVNYARSGEVFNKITDSYTYVNSTVKDDIIATYAEPFPV